ncbi:MAG: methyltransferase domain-containing protein [Pseudonocardiaceae bacterium]
MKSPTATPWRKRASALADSLAERGILRSEVWRAAVEQTPRHLFVPASTSTTAAGSTAQEVSVDTWLDEVYSDVTLVVQRRSLPSGQAGDGEPAALPTSSSTMPSLMVEMLEALDLHSGHRVLEIGTGTGYNAALLSYRLGAENVVSVDIDPGLVQTATQRLEELGHSPTLVTGDGLAGVPDHGPYNRIIATCAVPEVPLAWIDQLAPGGAMLINLRGEVAGVLCLLTKHDDDDEVIGPAVSSGGDFMWLRRELNSPLRDEESPTVISARKVARRLTVLSPTDVLGDRDFFWLLQLELPGLRMICSTEVFDPMNKVSRPGLHMYAEDGSHVQVINEPETDGQYRVIQGGCRRLWDTVETAHASWVRLANPAPHRFNVVANSTIQFVSLDSDTNWLRWPLPLV